MKKWRRLVGTLLRARGFSNEERKRVLSPRIWAIHPETWTVKEVRERITGRLASLPSLSAHEKKAVVTFVLATAGAIFTQLPKQISQAEKLLEKIRKESKKSSAKNLFTFTSTNRPRTGGFRERTLLYLYKALFWQISKTS